MIERVVYGVYGGVWIPHITPMVRLVEAIYIKPYTTLHRPKDSEGIMSSENRFTEVFKRDDMVIRISSGRDTL